MRKVIKKVYKFRELSETAKEKAIYEYIHSLISMTNFENLHKNSAMYRAYNKTMENKTPWFLDEYIWKYCEKQILSDLKQYEYYENGDFFEGE